LDARRQLAARPTCQAASTGSVPTMVVRCITRRSRGSCGVT
jgi:hypothetical protein